MMAGDDDPKEFPDVSQKLSAPKKLSAFERDRIAAEEKRKREVEENAAALREFEESLGGQDNSDDFDGFPSFRGPPTHPRGGAMGYGRPAGRYGGPPQGPRSGPGSLGPAPGMQPPSLKRKRALDEMREAQEAKREHDAVTDSSLARAALHDQHRSPEQDDEEREDVAPRPTVQVSSLPPSITAEEVKSLLRDLLPVHSVHFQPPTASGPAAKRSLTAIVTLSAETSTSQIDTTVSTLKDTYLGCGYRLSISRHLSSTSLLPSLAGASTTSSTEPFGAEKLNRDLPRGGFSMRNAPPPSEFAPPDSYDRPARHTVSATAIVKVQPPLDICTIRAIHTMADRLLSETSPGRALELEAMLMSLPEVQRDERFSFLYDSTSPAGVYYRYLLWSDGNGYDAIQQRKRLAKGSERVIEDVVIDWLPPYEEVPFADLSRLGEVIDHPNYDSSDEESDDGDSDQRQNTRRDVAGAESADKKHLTPLQVAKFAWILSKMPSNHSQLRKGDVAAVTDFAIKHAGAGAEEIVDMLILNVERPYADTLCAKFDDGDAFQDEDDEYEPDQELPTIESTPVDDVKVEKKDAEDPSQAKLVALYLINDVLHNSSTAGVRNAWKYRQLFENAFKRQNTFQNLGKLEKDLGWGRIKADQWRRRVGVLFDIWENGSVFANDVFDTLKKNFFDQPTEDLDALEKPEDVKKMGEKWMGRFKRIEGTASPAGAASPAPTTVIESKQPELPDDSNIDGAPMDDIDGVPMEDLDGAPMEDLGEAPTEDTLMLDAPADSIAEPSAAAETQSESVKAGTSFSLTAANGGKPAQPVTEPKRRKLAEDMFADSDEE